MSSGIFIDSCIIINHWRTPDHDYSILSQIRRKYNYTYISVITEYELLNGMTELFEEYWNNCLTWLIVLPVDRTVVQNAGQIRYKLKKQIENIGDLELVSLK
ncbi:MAG: hypothetical protein LBU34_03025 [Planctomycetaceae bacterium]|nr:hypothetical protein [Planctomycetaceae bacterium]